MPEGHVERHGRVIRPYTMVGGLFAMHDETPFPQEDEVPALKVGDLCAGWATEPGLGVCPCRCHRSDQYGDSAKRIADRHGIPAFDEDQLREDEADDD